MTISLPWWPHQKGSCTYAVVKPTSFFPHIRSCLFVFLSPRQPLPFRLSRLSFEKLCVPYMNPHPPKIDSTLIQLNYVPGVIAIPMLVPPIPLRFAIVIPFSYGGTAHGSGFFPQSLLGVAVIVRWALYRFHRFLWPRSLSQDYQ